jgi:hypothetical protein
MTGVVIQGPWTAAAKKEPEPPTAAYIQARERLGMPSHAGALLRACPWCKQLAGQPCIVRGVWRRILRPHQARTQQEN